MTAIESSEPIPLGDGRHALAVERPSSIDELRDRIHHRIDEGSAIYPQGGRTALDYGGTPGRPGVALDLQGLDRIIDYPVEDMTITVEAGITLEALQNTLGAEGQRLRIDAPCPARATIGGIFATNEAGPRRFGWGRPRDQIIGIGFVNARGELVRGGGRVVKNVAGYDFPKLLTGSMGSIGTICELTLVVRPRPEASAVAWVGFDRLDEADAALALLNTSASRPVAVELINRTAAAKVFGDPGLEPDNWIVVIGLEDNAASVRWQIDALADELATGRMATAEGSDAEAIFSALVDHTAGFESALSLMVTTRPSAVAAFARGLDPELWSIQAHAQSGIVRAHLLGELPALDEATVLVETLRREAAASGGHLTLPRCPTDWKSQLRVWGDPRSDWPLMEQLKQALDPDGMMNPGRFIGTI